MRKVFQNHELPHIWASRSQPFGRNPSESFYFDGATIYSYGSHFPIATLVDYKGELLCFFTTETYSTTTAKHISYARRAIPDSATIIYVETPPTHTVGLAYLREVADEKAENFRSAVESISQPRIRQATRDARKSQAITVAHEYNEFIAKFKIRRQPIQTRDLEAESEAIRGRQERAQALRQRKNRQGSKERAAAQQKQAQRELAALAQWAKGVAEVDGHHSVVGRYCHSFCRHPVRLRVICNQIETSHGANIPLALAKGLYRRFQQARAQGSFDGLNKAVGIYQADKVSGDHFVIGCHRVPFAEIERIAVELGISQPAAIPA